MDSNPVVLKTKNSSEVVVDQFKKYLLVVKQAKLSKNKITSKVHGNGKIERWF